MEYLEVDGLGPVSRIGLGTWQFGSREWGYGDSYADRAALDIVRRARELGITLFDTAEVYGFGRSERILGEALGHERGEVVVASKVLPVGRQRPPPRAVPDPALPAAPAQPVRAGLGDHAGDAQPARRGADRRGGGL